jgi:hypothetical protein
MTYRGRVQGGVIVLEDARGLLEGAEVQVQPVENAEPPTWAEVLKEVIGTADGLPADSSRNHDHYLYGLEKQ